MVLSLNLIPYTRRNRRDVLRLVNDGRCFLHVHLDWETIDDWLDGDDSIMVLGWHERQLIGAMAASPPEDDTSWLRMVAIAEEVDPQIVMPELWSAVRQMLLARSVRELGVLLLQPWLMTYLGDLGFSYVEHIVTLRRESWDVPPPLRQDVSIRHPHLQEIDTALRIDHAAFDPMWRMAYSGMRQAVRSCASFTLAELNGQAVGYQITTPHPGGAHLARLAVLPDVQGEGIGGALLSELVDSLLRRGIHVLSVNTQASNLKSRNLYTQYGFSLTGLDMPYWHTSLTER